MAMAAGLHQGCPAFPFCLTKVDVDTLCYQVCHGVIISASGCLEKICVTHQSSTFLVFSSAISMEIMFMV
jgi:hypothetical protein